MSLIPRYHHVRRGITIKDPNEFKCLLDAAVQDAVLSKQVLTYKPGMLKLRNLPHVTEYTVCDLMAPNGKVVARGYAFVGEEDQFCAAFGREYAFEMAHMRMDLEDAINEIRSATMARIEAAKATREAEIREALEAKKERAAKIAAEKREAASRDGV